MTLHHHHPQVSPPTYEISMKGTLAWKLVFEYENPFDESVTHTFTRTRMSSYSSRTFSLALNRATLSYLRESLDVEVDHNDVFFEVLSASVPASCEDSQEINGVLNKTRGGLEVECMSTETDTRTYIVGPDAPLTLYQLYFTAPGIHHDCNVYSVASEKQQEKVSVDIAVKCQQVRFISGISLQIGHTPEEEPIGCIHQYDRGLGDVCTNNINHDYANKYAWLIPMYTLNKSQAATSFELVIGVQDQESTYEAHHAARQQYSVNLSQDTNTVDHRQLNPVISDSPYKVYELALLRSPDGETLSWDPTWGFDGMSSDVNESRKGSPLYLAWKLRAAAIS
ncbi:hypothetical protein NM688_g336 [Phlebia brevispora]|uniref:Uncharacterized protein n=1 Tax=Phlebia brevispora TaxID=194682 RepID=A0ACC1TEL4_9APHY|nr:hypothetical protein NM688_g336 [Phlebia brevispora]